jgi:hypothetical protein
MRRLFTAGAIAALSIVAASCGDDDDATSTTDDTVAVAATADDAAEPDDTEAEPEDTSEPADTEPAHDTEPADDTEPGDDSGDGDSDLSAECLAIKEEMESQFSNDSDFGEIAEAIDKVKEFTPDDIDDDVDVLAGVYDEMAVLIEENGGDIATAMQNEEVIAQLESMNSPEVQEATANIQAYFEERCPGTGS